MLSRYAVRSLIVDKQVRTHDFLDSGQISVLVLIYATQVGGGSWKSNWDAAGWRGWLVGRCKCVEVDPTQKHDSFVGLKQRVMQ